jgi:sigma-B regulation protein RsbU (phosphoserine phosphatase)
MPYGASPVILESAGFPVGLLDNEYEERTIRLGPGDRVYLYSDGVTEAMDSSDTQFGAARVLTTIDPKPPQLLKESVNGLLGDIMHWLGAKTPQDDISILAFELTGDSVISADVRDESAAEV